MAEMGSVQFSSVAQSCLTLQPHESQHARPLCPSPTPGVHSDSRPSSQWCHPAISSSVVPFSSCPQSLPASTSFPMSQLFICSGQSTGVSALASFLPKKSQGWWWTGRLGVLWFMGLQRVGHDWATGLNWFVYFCFYFQYSGRWVMEDMLWFMSESALPMFSSRSFIVSGLTFRSLIHFELIFVCVFRKWSSFILFQAVDQFSQHHLLKRLSFLHCIFLPPLLKIRCP